MIEQANKATVLQGTVRSTFGIYSSELAMPRCNDGVFRVIRQHSQARRVLVTFMLLPLGMATWRRYHLFEPWAQVGQGEDSNIRSELVMNSVCESGFHSMVNAFWNSDKA